MLIDISLMENEIREMLIEISEMKTDNEKFFTYTCKMETDIGEMETDISEMETDTEIFFTYASEMEIDTGEMLTDISEMVTDTSEIRTDISEMLTDISEIQIDKSEMLTDIGEMKTDFAAIEIFFSKRSILSKFKNNEIFNKADRLNIYDKKQTRISRKARINERYIKIICVKSCNL